MPADGRIIAAYDDKDGSKAAKQREENEKHNAEREKMSDEDKDEDKADRGQSLASIDQSAITGESLAVEKYLGDTVCAWREIHLR